ncbi:MAG: FAD-dependent oxidoreductase [Thermoleophilia bacterium]|nr:FAD-dependent oxidoreductase [Thermoleophilia bacterium]
MDPDPNPPGRTLTTRRRFLGLLALGGSAALAGCSGLTKPVREAAESATRIVSPTDPPVLTGTGPEPSSFVPPLPVARPSRFTDPLELVSDVCVVGGGAAGCAAATTAGRMGARTILLEESYCLGGNVTRGLVNLDKVAWGGSEAMVAGYFRELIKNLEAEGQAVYPGPQTHFAVPYEPDAFRHSALILARRAGADVRFGARAAWVERAGDRIEAVWAEEEGRMLRIRSKVFVDCTGDGHLGYMAGNGFWLGDRLYGEIQGQTLIFCAGPVDFSALQKYADSTGGLTNTYQVIGLRDFMYGAVASGKVEGRPQRGLLINRNMESTFVSISGSEVYSNHLEPGTLAKIMTMLQKQNFQIHAALRAEIPGFESSRVTRMAERPYLREGRRLIGWTQLTADEVLAGRKPADSIARGWYPIDLHVSYGGGLVHRGQLRAGDWYGVPFRCLVARDLDNLMMAGRCISATHEALASARISPVSMALGQAAGVGAALSVKAEIRPADLEAEKVREEIIRQGGLI